VKSLAGLIAAPSTRWFPSPDRFLETADDRAEVPETFPEVPRNRPDVARHRPEEALDHPDIAIDRARSRADVPGTGLDRLLRHSNRASAELASADLGNGYPPLDSALR